MNKMNLNNFNFYHNFPEDIGFLIKKFSFFDWELESKVTIVFKTWADDHEYIHYEEELNWYATIKDAFYYTESVWREWFEEYYYEKIGYWDTMNLHATDIIDFFADATRMTTDQKIRCFASWGINDTWFDIFCQSHAQKYNHSTLPYESDSESENENQKEMETD